MIGKPVLIRGAAALIVLLQAAAAFSQPHLFNGHYYEVIEVPAGISWSDARTAASGNTFPVGGGQVGGRLVTLETSEEFAAIEAFRQAAGLDEPEVWIGGFQRDPAAAPGASWEWITGTPIPGIDSCSASVPGDVVYGDACDGDGDFADWQPGEPDDKRPNPESFLSLGQNGDRRNTQAGFNDQDGLLEAYIVEYVVDSLSSCTDDDGCDTTPDGVTVKLPFGLAKKLDSDGAEVAIAFVSELLLDDRIVNWPAGAVPAGASVPPLGWVPPADWIPVCNGQVKIVPDPDTGLVALTIPGFLCGSPYLQRITSLATNLSLADGLVVFAADQLPENGGESGRYVCGQNPGDDIRFRHRAVWQTTDLRDPFAVPVAPDMPENLPGNYFRGFDGATGFIQPSITPSPAVFPSANAFTSGCGSIEGRLARKSHFVVGLHAQCNRMSSPVSPPTAPYQETVSWQTVAGRATVVKCFSLLVENKLSLLAQEVADARADFVISQGDAQKMINQVQNAASKLAAGNYNEASTHLTNFLDAYDRSVYNPPAAVAVQEKNYHGRHLSRFLNIRFMLDNDILPYVQ